MRSAAYKFVYRIVFGLMFLLAGTCNCYCDSYDADPYDDIPPVTVEFNYLVPGTASAQVASTYSSVRPVALPNIANAGGRNIRRSVVFAADSSLEFTPVSPEFAIPLRT